MHWCSTAFQVLRKWCLIDCTTRPFVPCDLTDHEADVRRESASTFLRRTVTRGEWIAPPLQNESLLQLSPGFLEVLAQFDLKPRHEFDKTWWSQKSQQKTAFFKLWPFCSVGSTTQRKSATKGSLFCRPTKFCWKQLNVGKENNKFVRNKERKKHMVTK